MDIVMAFMEYGLLMSFFLVVLEYCCFPIPSELVLPFIGYMVSKNGYSLLGVILMSIIMGFLGCFICYLIGYYGGSKIYNKLYNKFPSWRKSLDATHKFFYKYGGVSVMIGRVLPLFRTYISFFGGIFKQSLFKYSFYSFMGISIWNTVLILLGYYFSSNYSVVENYYSNYKFFVICLLSVLLVTFFAYKVYKKRKKTKTINGD